MVSSPALTETQATAIIRSIKNPNRYGMPGHKAIPLQHKVIARPVLDSDYPSDIVSGVRETQQIKTSACFLVISAGKDVPEELQPGRFFVQDQLHLERVTPRGQYWAGDARDISHYYLADDLRA